MCIRQFRCTKQDWIFDILMKYFWLEESDIPDGRGFNLFGPEHAAVLIISMVLICSVSFAYTQNKKWRRRILVTISSILPLTELCKTVFLVMVGRYGIGHLPMHLCSLSIIIYPLYTIIKAGRIKDFLKAFSCLVLCPAGVGALLFPDWTMYPIISFMSILSFFWHVLQVLLPICIISAGEICPRSKEVLFSIVFLVMTAVPVYLFDLHFSSNYYFLLRPVPGPLEMVYSSFGYRIYLPVLIFMVVFVIFAVYFIMKIVEVVKRKSS